MEVGSVAHRYYLLNIRLPVNEKKKINVGIGEIKDIRFVVSLPLIGICVCEVLWLMMSHTVRGPLFGHLGIWCWC